jgi:CDP-diacylglycerol---glycerol-3-phosphate 3-phosphatidyltransferase
MSTPIILTYFRILFIPFLVAAYYLLPAPINQYVSCAMYFIAGMTDWLDGYLARKWNQESAFGAFLDPVADKLMVSTALIIILIPNETLPDAVISPWVAAAVAIIIGREIFISALREWMAGEGERAAVKVSWTGKVKTAAQMWAIGFLLFHYDLWGMPVETIGYGLLALSTVLTIWSMVEYIYAARHVLAKHM